MADDQGRPCIGDIIAERVMAGHRMFHVGRLDADTEGLLLLTNDGELAHRLMHPSYEVPKTYMATVKGEVPRSLNHTLRAGVELDDGPVKVDSFTIVDVNNGASLVEIVLHEGRNRIVRRLMEKSAGAPTAAHPGRRCRPRRPAGRQPAGARPRRIGGLYGAVGL